MTQKSTSGQEWKDLDKVMISFLAHFSNNVSETFQRSGYSLKQSRKQ